MRIVVAIHDLPVWSIPPAQVRRVAEALPDDDVVDAREPSSRPAAYASADVLFATRLKPGELGSDSPVRWIHSSAVGVGTLLTPEVLAGPVVVSNSRGVHSEAIAEHAIALMLALRRSLHVAVRRQSDQMWAQEEFERHVVPTASQSHVLVAGLGTIGARVAAMAAGLGMRVTGIRRRPDAPAPPGVSRVVAPEALLRVLPDADVVVLALPRTQQTRAFIGAPELAAMKPTAFLINVARGRLIDDEALVSALESGQIGGAGLDAFQVEPLPPGSTLWRLPNVLVSPHSASFTGDYWTPVVDLFLENVARFKRGDPLLNVVDKARGY